MDQDRRAAFLILKDMAQNASYSNLAVNSVLETEPVNSSAFVRELVYGVLRNQLLLDYNINKFLQKPNIKLSDRILLRMGFYQIAYTEVPDYAAVSETVSMAAAFVKGRQGFINAVLRSFLRAGKKIVFPDENASDYLSIKYSVSPDIAELLEKVYGRTKAAEMLENANRPMPLSVRVNTLKTDKYALKKLLRSEGFETEDGHLSSKSLIVKGSGVLSGEAFKRGLFSVQGEASQLAVEKLSPAKGSRVLDLCAAPGGKSCAAAELMENSGEILSFDFYENRCGLISKEAQRLGINIIKTAAKDACVYDPALSESADYIICDVPCSGLGVIGRKPELKLKGLDKEHGKLPAKQYSILRNASKYIKKGGKILYSTCTIDPEENTKLVNRFVEGNPGFEIEFEQQLLPDRNGCDGFYISIIRSTND